MAAPMAAMAAAAAMSGPRRWTGWNTLIDFRYQQHSLRQERTARHGAAAHRQWTARISCCAVPAGTEILEEDQETVIADLAEVGDRVLLARGGNGGFGNLHFKDLDQPGAAAGQCRTAGGRADDLAAAEADRGCGPSGPAQRRASRPSSRRPRTRGRRSRIIPLPRWFRTSASWVSTGRSFVVADIPRPDRGRPRGQGAGRYVPGPCGTLRGAAASGGPARRRMSSRITRRSSRSSTPMAAASPKSRG